MTGNPMTDGHDRFSAFSTAVLDLVDRIPPGRVMTFGAIADHLGQGGPRGVGGVMARHGYDVAWWRVVRADGTLPAYLMIDAQPHWIIEHTATRHGLVNVETAQWRPEDCRREPTPSGQTHRTRAPTPTQR